MFDIEKIFHKVNEKLPLNGQRVIAFNGKFDEFVAAFYNNGKFYEDDKELANITRWIENNNNIDI